MENTIGLNDSRFEIREATVSDLLLDLENPRIRLLSVRNQAEALEKLYTLKSEQMYQLARDICENGISIMPVVVTDDKDGNGGFVVKDGNRRIAVLKLLQNPNLLQNRAGKERFKRLKERCSGHIPDTLSVYYSSDENRIMNYLGRLHTGTGAGEGQLDWSAVEKAFFELDEGQKGQNDLAARLLKLALNYRIPFSAEFPITTLTRLVNADRLKDLGFYIGSDGEVSIPEDNEHIVAILRTIIDDIERGKVHVRRDNSDGSIYARTQQEAYLHRLSVENLGASASIREEGVRVSNGRIPAEPEASSIIDPSTIRVSPYEESPDEQSVASSTAVSTAVSGHSVMKDPYDRRKVIQRKEHKIILAPGHKAPEKVRSLINELRYLIVDKTPLATALTVRALLDIVTSHCIDISGLKGAPKRGLSDRMRYCIERLHSHGKLTKDEKDAALRLCADEDSLSITGLNKVAHNLLFTGDPKSVNRVWGMAQAYIQAASNTLEGDLSP